jgi:hypothetical protein
MANEAKTFEKRAEYMTEETHEQLKILEDIVSAQLARFISTSDKYTRKDEEMHLYHVRNLYKELKAQIAHDPKKPYTPVGEAA